jgi:hypothetical protein
MPANVEGYLLLASHPSPCPVLSAWEGLMTASSQIAYLNDGFRFDSGNVVSKGHISHMGNKCIRRNIIQAASRKSAHNPLSVRYNDLRARGKCKQVAAVAVALPQKLCRRTLRRSYTAMGKNGFDMRMYLQYNKVDTSPILSIVL